MILSAAHAVKVTLKISVNEAPGGDESQPVPRCKRARDNVTCSLLPPPFYGPTFMQRTIQSSYKPGKDTKNHTRFSEL